MLLLLFVLLISGEAALGTEVHLFKNRIRFLEGSWNHEYFGSLAKSTALRVSLHDSMNLPKLN